MIELICKNPSISDIGLYYKWTNDPMVRKNSFNQEIIPYNEHVKWFTKKLESNDCCLYLFLTIDNIPVGQVRIDKDDNENIIGLSIDEQFRGMSLGTKMIEMACVSYSKEHNEETIVAYIKETNISSYKIFKKAGFNDASKILYSDNVVFRLIRQLI
jgi:RimJ/RimL family protein N-acetyltransferase